MQTHRKQTPGLRIRSQGCCKILSTMSNFKNKHKIFEEIVRHRHMGKQSVEVVFRGS
jgi:hypothetical protein